MNVLTEEYKDHLDQDDDEVENYRQLVAFLEKMHILYDFISTTPNITLSIRIAFDKNVKSSINTDKWLKERLATEQEEFVSTMVDYLSKNLISEFRTNNEFWHSLYNKPTYSKIDQAKSVISPNISVELLNELLKIIVSVKKICAKKLSKALIDNLEQFNIIIICVRMVINLGN